MAVLAVRYDVPDADPGSVDPMEIASQHLDRFNDWVRSTPQKGPEVGLETREASWED